MREAQRAWSGSRPSSRFEVKTFAVFARREMESRRFAIIIGIATLRSRSDPTPPRPPTMIAVSLPMTWQQAMMAASQMTGLTFPGMMDEPGWTAGILSSPMPQRGPDPSQRMSFAILVMLTAMVRRFALAPTMASRVCCASKWLVASRK